MSVHVNDRFLSCLQRDASLQEFTERTKIACPRCGDFSITSTARKSMRRLESDEMVKASGWLREHESIEIRVEDLPKLYNLRTPTVGEKADKLLLHFAREYPVPGPEFPIDNNSWNDLTGVCWASSSHEVVFLLDDYLGTEKGFLSTQNSGVARFYKITPKGWSHLDSLRRPSSESATGFIATWFDMSVNSAWLAIENGIRAAGYSPERIDQKEHNNKIDDEIIAGIRRSRFLVADFTGHRGRCVL